MAGLDPIQAIIDSENAHVRRLWLGALGLAFLASLLVWTRPGALASLDPGGTLLLPALAAFAVLPHLPLHLALSQPRLRELRNQSVDLDCERATEVGAERIRFDGEYRAVVASVDEDEVVSASSSLRP